MALVSRVVSGGTCIAGAGMGVTVTSVFLYVDAYAIGGSGGTVTAATADPFQDRYDAIVADKVSGAISILTNPIPGLTAAPAQDDKEPLAIVQVPAGATSSASFTITDVRNIQKIQDEAVDLAYTFVPGALSTADPGMGKFGFDATTNGAITKLIISLLSPSAPFDVDRFFSRPSGGSFPVYVCFYSATDPDQFWIGQITGTASGGSALIWAAYPITFVRQGGHSVGAEAGIAPDLSSNAYEIRLLRQWFALPAAATGTLIKRTIYTSGSGATHTFDTTCKKFRVIGVGGGGAGGGVNNNLNPGACIGGGGGAAGYFEALLTLVGTTATYTVGAAGTGSAAANGGNGADTTFLHNSITYTAAKGLGGTAQAGGTTSAAVAGGTGGAVTNGDLQVPGQDGEQGCRLSGTQVLGGDGGDSELGSGGRGADIMAAATATNAGNVADGYGAGGSGASGVRNAAGSATAAGGNGKGGVIIVEEYT